MTSKERVAEAIAHREADRVPICATYVPEVELALREKHNVDIEEDLGVFLGNDMVKIASGLENSYYMNEDPTYVCPYGITWKNTWNETGRYSEIHGNPLAGDTAKLKDYKIPDPTKDFKVLNNVKKAVEKYGKDKWIIGSCQCTIFEASWYLRGLDTFMMDMALDEDYTNELMDKVMEYPHKMGLQFIDAGVDMVWLGDDIATQLNMMISPDMWREYLKPRYAKMFSDFKAKNPNIKLCYHSCGNLQSVVPDLIEIGLDVLNPIQPLAMNPMEFKKKFGDNLTMYGTLDVQNVMPFGTPSDVDNEVKRLIDGCGQNGGFILSPAHHIQSDTSIENIEAFYNAAKKYGAYKK